MLFIDLHALSYFFRSIDLAVKISTMAARPEPDNSNGSLGEFLYRLEARLPGVLPDDRNLGTYAYRQLLLYLFLQAVTSGVVSAGGP